MYPSLGEYIESVKYAADNLEKLKHLTPVLKTNGDPYYSQGNYAVVFKMRDADGKFYAMKCFTQEVAQREERYKLIADQLKYENSDYFVSIEYIEKEIFVSSNFTDETEFPVLLMEWVDGEPLDAYIRHNIKDKDSLSLLSYRFGCFAQWLLSQPFAHGDIKPDNILVRGDGTLVAIDYDGMYVPAMEGQKAEENGTPDFRHPKRTLEIFDEHIDDFTLASMALALEAIALEPSLLYEFSPKDRLLFSESDFLDISESRLLQRLLGMLHTENMLNLWTLFFVAYKKMTIPASLRDLFRMRLPDGKCPQIKKPKSLNEPKSLKQTKQKKEDTLSFTVGGVSFKMIRIEHGTFMMGATPEMEEHYYDEEPVHEVTISKDYYIGETQVTQELWQAVMGNNPSYFKGNNNPVENISCFDCWKFIWKLNELTGKHFRLPTEAEWEYAARGGNKSRHTQYSGSDDIDYVAWYWDNSGRQTHPVAKKSPNELGLYDMSGNVWEWCDDLYGAGYYAKSPSVDPPGSSSGSDRVLRGGSWGCYPGNSRSSRRYRKTPEYRHYCYGFRLAL
ncbi:MAG: hypothetical protein E7077_01520 [Bacteroidales bacterium]|jgi:formylglycine-generating enzyme required for sulfatase activity|nr:hypothetical protein [Bacteroidales bacterium]